MQKDTLYSHLKVCEFRFNHRHEDKAYPLECRIIFLPFFSAAFVSKQSDTCRLAYTRNPSSASSGLSDRDGRLSPIQVHGLQGQCSLFHGFQSIEVIFKVFHVAFHRLFLILIA